MSATNYRAEDLFVAANEADLWPRDELVVHLDVAHRGLGTASCGPDVLPQYRLPAGDYTFSYRLTLPPVNLSRDRLAPSQRRSSGIGRGDHGVASSIEALCPSAFQQRWSPRWPGWRGST